MHLILVKQKIIKQLNILFNFYFFFLESNTWSEVTTTGDIPEPRSGHTAVMNNSLMYIFGGRTQDPNVNIKYFSDIYQLDFSKFK